MSGNGEDDRGEAKADANPFLDGAEPRVRDVVADVVTDVVPDVVRKRRPKPPPNIISAGGVDMARAHASGIKLRDNTAPEPTLDQPRVVLAVETDPRKVPTHKRLLEGREPAGDGSRSALLPGGAINATPPSGGNVASSKGSPSGAAPAPAEAAGTSIEPPRRLPAGMRAALVLVLLLVVGGIAQRIRPRGESPVDARGPASRPPVPISVAPPLPTFAPAPRPQAVSPPESAAAAATPAPAAPAPTSAPRPAVQPARPPPASAPPRATFTPPFQLPGEKN